MLAVGLATGSPAWARETTGLEVVGEAFGKLIAADEFAYDYKTAVLFTRREQPDKDGKPKPRTDEEIRREAWQNLVFLREADRLVIRVDRVELHNELARLLSEQHLTVGSKEYQEWVVSRVKEDVPTFERRVEDVLRVNALLKMKSDPDVTVTDADVREQFLSERNMVEAEYIQFGSQQEAEAFLARLRQDASIWKETFDRRRSESGRDGAAWIGLMSIEMVSRLWDMPKEEVARVQGSDEGAFVVARRGRGEAVFRVLHTRTASFESLDEKERVPLRSRTTMMKKRQAAQAYFDELFARAKLRDYEQERREEAKRTSQASTVSRLAARSQVVLRTTHGEIELRLWPEVAPKACENFIGLIERGYYNGLTFHRVIKAFMIQGGDPTGTGTGGQSLWGKSFEDETRADVTFNRPGLLAMANAGPHTNGSQFFITTVPTPWLNGKHTIFGEVVAGLDVVKGIEGVPTDSASKPLEAQQIITAAIKSQSASPTP